MIRFQHSLRKIQTGRAENNRSWKEAGPGTIGELPPAAARVSPVSEAAISHENSIMAHETIPQESQKRGEEEAGRRTGLLRAKWIGT